ncbi:hypothetical protein [Natrarchaeobius oligotrophus]|uniref:CopG family transcriptional regulator n=1 Tax=Natrarchaeobius chitinivorans TaxID=1679083 RepID=A0A3N6MQF4_NATCH|nr:hypothetical protein [Natrarchaeobius chitinivorans]RQG98471.1 hypothetical protein EA472_17810 [Natrarchaeobius chitinivorans]
MAGEDHQDGGISFALPADVDDWISEEADRRDESREAVCRDMMTAAHAVATGDDHTSVDELVGRDDLESLEGQLEAQREEFRELLEDVRSRVVQVKRETDAKAAVDHDHPSHASDEELADLRDDVEALERRLDAGFGNFEEILERLLDRLDELDARSTTLASTVVDLRDRRDELAANERDSAAVSRLQLAANQLGIRTAACEDCGASVDVGLLTRPECPHCSSSIADVAEKSSFFGSHRLLTGDPPSLESAPSSDLDTQFDYD